MTSNAFILIVDDEEVTAELLCAVVREREIASERIDDHRTVRLGICAFVD